MWVTLIASSILVLIALGVIGAVAIGSHPEGGLVRWCVDSFKNMRSHELSTKEFTVAHQETEIDSIFDTFSRGSSGEYLVPEQLNEHIADFRIPASAEKLIVGTDELLNRTSEIAKKGTRRVAEVALRTDQKVKQVLSAPSAVTASAQSVPSADSANAVVSAASAPSAQSAPATDGPVDSRDDADAEDDSTTDEKRAVTDKAA
ncbi:MAG: hypothetical protein GX483_00095 [Actinomycetaceae bacterium]|nr:hypothetical protein [Actinomycetaceae bacterium]